MQTNFKVAAAIAASFLLGASAALTVQASIDPVRAQSPPVSINVAEITVKDEAAYKEWLPPVQKQIAAHGGIYLAGGFNKTTTIMGEAPPNRVVIIQFPSLDAVKKWWQEAGEADTTKAAAFASFRIYTVEGVEKK